MYSLFYALHIDGSFVSLFVYLFGYCIRSRILFIFSLSFLSTPSTLHTHTHTHYLVSHSFEPHSHFPGFGNIITLLSHCSVTKRSVTDPWNVFLSHSPLALRYLMSKISYEVNNTTHNVIAVARQQFNKRIAIRLCRSQNHTQTKLSRSATPNPSTWFLSLPATIHTAHSPYTYVSHFSSSSKNVLFVNGIR